ncbi:MAG TPA: hypothetical protein VNO75_03175 [Gemmatimonadaceae bacterium]|nr:hypothetical protein [Gemmatimonadaceae bacterium]
MPRSALARHRTALITLSIWLQACASHRPVPQDMSALTGHTVKVRSAEPFPIMRPGDTVAPIPVRMVRRVEGRVRRVAGDTLAIAHGVDASGRRALEVVNVVRTPATEIIVSQTDWRRTTILLAVITAALVGFAAFAASQITYAY